MKNQGHNLALLFLCFFISILCSGCTKSENKDKVVIPVGDVVGTGSILNLSLSSTYKCNFLGADNKQ